MSGEEILKDSLETLAEGNQRLRNRVEELEHEAAIHRLDKEDMAAEIAEFKDTVDEMQEAMKGLEDDKGDLETELAVLQRVVDAVSNAMDN